MAASDILKHLQKSGEQLLLYWLSFLSSNNSLTGCDFNGITKLLTIQSYIDLCFISKRLIHILQKESVKIWQLNFSSKKVIHLKEKACVRFKLFKSFQRSAQKQSTDALTTTK